MRPSRRRRWTRRLRRAALLVTAAIALVVPPLNVYAAFAVAYLLRERLARLSEAVRLPVGAKLAASIMAAGLLVLEPSSWLGSRLAGEADPALLHPQLGADLLLAVGFYGAWAVAWPPALRADRFTLSQVAVTTGLYGVVVEQRGAVLVQGLATLPAGLLLWGFVFVTYGSTMGLAYLPVQRELERSPARDRRWKYLRVVLLLVAAQLVVGVAWQLAVGWLLPPRRSIVEHPLW